jgi:hypothetical protein
MADRCRECDSESLEVVQTERPFSNFQFIQQRFPTVRTLRRFFSQARAAGGKTLVIEELNPSHAVDTAEENDDISRRFSAVVASRVWRLSFFSKAFRTRRGLLGATGDDFIGYAIVKCDNVHGQERCTRIFESVMPFGERDNNFIRGKQRWISRVGACSFETEGYLYAQQNNVTNVCAHVACRTAAARFHADGDMTYREMNALSAVGIDHIAKTVDDGLDSQQMRSILEAAGAKCVVGDYTQQTVGVDPPPFQKMLYGSIESGYPAIICFATENGDGHAIPVFGHTFNEDTWVPNAEWGYFRIGARTAWMPSENWLSTFIAHDDNWGSNYCVPRHYLYSQRRCDKWPTGSQPCAMQSQCVAYVLATLPRNVEVNAIAAEAIGADFLFSMLPQIGSLNQQWGNWLSFYARQNLLVLRPILTTTKLYAEHLKTVTDWGYNHVRPELPKAIARLDESHVWMVELSVPELFSANRRKVGEVVILAEAKPGHNRDFGNYLLSRVPGYFAFYKGGGVASPRYAFVPSGLEGHVPLFGCE